MDYRDCPHVKRIDALEADMKDRIQQDAAQTAVLNIINDRFDKLEQKIDLINKELHNGLIPKKASQWFYSSVGKWIIGLLAGNVFTIVVVVVKLLIK